ncbi:MAG: KaiC 1 [Desulfatitalea sp. BRH_c12]|nr:MAG: KaiC 1 [Desulfatitalea sp. BRH_c12]
MKISHGISALPKSPTGIKGFDEITFGGLPKGRPTLVSGGAGSGKTLFGMEFIIRGAVEYAEPGVFVSFEESEEDLVANFKSLGFDLVQLQADKKLYLDYVHIDRSEIEETGEFNLEGLFVRLGFAIDAISARRVVLDTLEALFSGFANQFILRSEIRRLFRWLKDRGVTAVITAERGSLEGGLTRHGLEEYVSDCVIALDHRVHDQLSTRRMRVVKYRGSTHGTNEYPFLLDEGGISVLPITSVGLDYAVTNERISTGIPRLDVMFGGKGFFRGSSILISGTAGTGKTSFASQFVYNTCKNGERCLYFAFEESSSQIVRNMRSLGMDLEPLIGKGLLRYESVRPTSFGLETHLAKMIQIITEFTPSAIVIDPISNMINVGSGYDVKIALMRLVDMLKSKLITSLFTSLLQAGRDIVDEHVGVSSLMDTWMLLREIESGGEANRIINIVKSRGMAHSNQLREFVMSDQGIEFVDVYTGPAGVLTGTARVVQEAREKTEWTRIQREIERKKRDLERKRLVTEARINELQARMDSDQEEIEKLIQEHQMNSQTASQVSTQMARMRMADTQE